MLCPNSKGQPHDISMIAASSIKKIFGYRFRFFEVGMRTDVSDRVVDAHVDPPKGLGVGVA